VVEVFSNDTLAASRRSVGHNKIQLTTQPGSLIIDATAGSISG
jgi:hypothetical protein